MRTPRQAKVGPRGQHPVTETWIERSCRGLARLQRVSRHRGEGSPGTSIEEPPGRHFTCFFVARLRVVVAGMSFAHGHAKGVRRGGRFNGRARLRGTDFAPPDACASRCMTRVTPSERAHL